MTSAVEVESIHDNYNNNEYENETNKQQQQHQQPHEEQQHRRQLWTALPDGNCERSDAQFAPHPIKPVWQASYPGSGARMTWMLVEALTGTLTNTDYDVHERGYERVVSVKTHYPMSVKDRFERVLDPLFERAIVIVRNPKDAIPSLFNWAWERAHHVPTHTERGPQADWFAFRMGECDEDTAAGICEGGVLRQIQNFEYFVDFWMTKYPNRDQLLLVSYEQITSEETGPQISAQIAEFLGTTDGVNPIDPSSIPCVWENIVNYKKMKKADVNGLASQRKGPKLRPYSKHMLEEMIAMLERLLVKYRKDPQLFTIIDSYIDDVMEAQVEEGLKPGDILDYLQGLLKKYRKNQDAVDVLNGYLDAVAQVDKSNGGD